MHLKIREQTAHNRPSIIVLFSVAFLLFACFVLIFAFYFVFSF